MKKKATIYDIAKALNITVSTVSRALSGFPAISDATRKAVLDMAKEMNYSPNRLASALKSGKTYVVGIIVPSVQAHFFASVIHRVEEVLKANQYRLIIYQSNESVEDEINGIKTLLEAQVDGIMASISLETDDVTHFTEVIKQGKPLVLFDRVSDGLNVPTVTLNDFKAAYLATEHLIVSGYKRIALVTTSRQIKLFSERLKGCLAAFEKYGVKEVEEWMIFGGLSIADGQLAAQKLMEMDEKPDAIIAGDDFTALGISQKLKELNVTPSKVGVIGFANESFSGYVTPGLTTVEQYPGQMGEACASLFLEMLKLKNPFEHIRHIVIDPDIVIRQSTQKK